MSKKLIIVESPTKAKTISKFLSKDYSIIATKGHVEDLPKSKFGIDVDDNFKPDYVILKDKGNLLKEIKKEASASDTIYIATDPDREGEAIGWHVLNSLALKNPDLVKRIAFHEITQSALEDAINHPTVLNMNLVDAQQARRVLDRIVGYKLSPLLWSKIRYGLSAGRVQSVALKIIVDREEERNNFVSQEYWNIVGVFLINGKEYVFDLIKINKNNFEIKNKEESDKISKDIKSGTAEIESIQKTETKKYPIPPYTTSTLQQDANRKLGFSSKKTMSIAQKLYEGVSLGADNVGLITYMRTDSVSMAEVAVDNIRGYINKNYEKTYLPNRKNIYKTKSKLAQEAHEAIRPAYIDKTPESIQKYVDKDFYRLYKLIWERALSSQMTPALYENKKVLINVKGDKNTYTFALNISNNVFKGYQVFNKKEESKDSKNPEFAMENKQDIKSLEMKKTTADQHFTEPPPRYNDASLVKILESCGVGRPSTYSSIISTLISRGYIERKEKYFIPTDVGIVVSNFLSKYFTDIVDTNFTADIENKLDDIANGKSEWTKIVSNFYTPFNKKIESSQEGIEKKDITNLGESTEVCLECGSPMYIKLGKYGKFLSCSRFPECKGMRSIETDKEEKLAGENCPQCGSELIIKKGRFGNFIACSNYPTCKYTKSLNENKKKVLDIKCPDCKTGNIVELKNRRGKTFYGCSNYPKCKFIANKLEDIDKK
ncbi:MAG: type I DNA topoisomerase [Patescibacteria group bacterium]